MQQNIIEILSLSSNKKALFKERYLNLLQDYKTRSSRYTVSFHTLRIIVGVGSLLVPALLSIQQINGTSDKRIDRTRQMEETLFWCTWILSLLVTMSNGLFTLMKVDKKYYFIHTLLEQLRSEGWQFLTMTGRYGIYREMDASGNINHDKGFALFCYMVEKIKMHQVEEEYYKLTDDYTKQERNGNNGTTLSTTSINSAAGTGIIGNERKTSRPHTPEPNTEIRVLPKTPQNILNLDGLPPEMCEQMRGVMEEAFKEMGVSEEVYSKYFNRKT
jgi:hypothetical protein